MLTIDYAEHETTREGAERYTLDHPAGEIRLEIIYDQDCASPLEDDEYAPALAMIDRGGRSDYIGTADNVPEEMEIPCAPCQGTGERDGSEDECPVCDGWGRIETDDLERYLRKTRGAVAVHEITVGGRDQAPAVLYFTAEEIDGAGIPDPAAALKAHADEYRKWEDGDCWGYVLSGPGSEDSCWGFIGSDYALEEATSAFDYAVQAADRELAESTYWAARDVATV